MPPPTAESPEGFKKVEPPDPPPYCWDGDAPRPPAPALAEPEPAPRTPTRLSRGRLAELYRSSATEPGPSGRSSLIPGPPTTGDMGAPLISEGVYMWATEGPPPAPAMAPTGGGGLMASSPVGGSAPAPAPAPSLAVAALIASIAVGSGPLAAGNLTAEAL